MPEEKINESQNNDSEDSTEKSREASEAIIDAEGGKKNGFMTKLEGKLPGRLKNKRWPIVAGIVVVVVIILGVGGTIVEYQPTSCNIVCHSPMDKYVNEYYSGSSTLLAVHKEAGLTCMNCHDVGVGEKATEVGAWLTDNFTKTLGKSNIATSEFCLRSGCHTQDEWNSISQHSSSNGKNDCGTCHVMH